MAVRTAHLPPPSSVPREHCCPGSWGPGGALGPPPWVTIPSQRSTDPPVVLAFLARNGRGARCRCWKRPMPAGEPLSKGKPGWGTAWPKQPAAFWVKSQLSCAQELAAITTKPVITSDFSGCGSVLEQFLWQWLQWWSSFFICSLSEAHPLPWDFHAIKFSGGCLLF